MDPLRSYPYVNWEGLVVWGIFGPEVVSNSHIYGIHGRPNFWYSRYAQAGHQVTGHRGEADKVVKAAMALKRLKTSHMYSFHAHGRGIAISALKAAVWYFSPQLGHRVAIESPLGYYRKSFRGAQKAASPKDLICKFSQDSSNSAVFANMRRFA